MACGIHLARAYGVLRRLLMSKMLRKAAFGQPGLEPRWTHGNKDGVGTAYSGGSRIWFTIFQGVVTETYFPTVDRPQLRDLQYLITDGKTFFHEERGTCKRRWIVDQITRSISKLPIPTLRDVTPSLKK
jgi:hypothetical protein